ncbi:MAG: MarR family transcriptional regulator [Acidobacteria bacterium]|nr:MarR family transcriptional regulator [Acidobacteriota bacterium]
MPTHYAGTPGEVKALDAYIKLMRAAESVSGRAARHLAASPLTLSQFGVLEALFHLGPLCQRDLGRKLLRSGGNIVMVVDNLEKRGLVERRRGKQDRRFVTVHLTGKGRRLIARIFPRHVAVLVKQMGALSASEQEKLGRLCRRLGRGKKA